MKVPKGRSYDTDILDTLSQRVMVGDGAMSIQLPDADLTSTISTTGAEAVETKYVRLQSG
jgi:hypothetical protein